MVGEGQTRDNFVAGLVQAFGVILLFTVVVTAIVSSLIPALKDVNHNIGNLPVEDIKSVDEGIDFTYLLTMRYAGPIIFFTIVVFMFYVAFRKQAESRYQ